jgi:rhodanese-related sulfurtransferase
LSKIRGVFASEDFADLERAGATIESSNEISIEDVAANKPAILDVRGRSEYAEGHIPGAINIPLAELNRRLDEIPSGEIAVHCQGGGRAAIAASILLKAGKPAANMSGGFTQWERSGLPTER